MLDRRSLLLGTLCAIGADAFAGKATAAEAPAFASAAQLGDGFGVVLLSAKGEVLRTIPLSARGHDIALHPASGRAVAFARRPGTFAVAFKLAIYGAPDVFTAIDGRHFYGHGAFSTDGRMLYVSENDIAGARGVIGMYDATRGYKRIGEFPSHGVGPHEIILLGDGRTLAVANGGLDTAPDAGRENLNLDTMQPSLTFVDSKTGDLKARHRLASEFSRLSLRHIAADAEGRVWFGGQWEGALEEAPSLIGFAGLDTGVKLIADADAPGVSLKGYIGSVAMDRGGAVFAASAPKAGRVVYVDCETGRVVRESALADACGIAHDDDTAFALSSGFGALRRETPDGRIIAEAELANVAFDNHLRRIG